MIEPRRSIGSALSVRWTIVTWVIPVFALVVLSSEVRAQTGTSSITYEGESGPGADMHVVMITGDQEYRSEEVLPMLGKILAEHHGFTVTVLFSVDPETGVIDPEHTTFGEGTHFTPDMPALEQLEDADLMVLFSRFLSLSDEQMDYIVDYTQSDRPIIGLRTATHAFLYEDGPYEKYSWMSEVESWEGGYGDRVFGETWYAHLGERDQSTRGLLNGLHEEHPILKGVGTMWGPSDVYHMDDIRGDETALVLGQLQNGATRSAEPDLDSPVVPIAWTKSYTSETGNTSRVFYTSWGLGEDFQDESVRRLMINATYWAVGMEDQIPDSADVSFVDPYDPAPRGVGNHKTGLTPADFAIGGGN